VPRSFGALRCAAQLHRIPPAIHLGSAEVDGGEELVVSSERRMGLEAEAVSLVTEE